MGSSGVGDFNRGTGIIIACWTLTGLVGSVLILRYAIKAWIRWILPRVSAPERIWGIEDVLYLCGFALDLAHMVCTQKSYQWGLGRHTQFLSPVQKANAIKYIFISQPLAIAAAMFSRTGMMWFVYTCLNNDHRVKRTVIPCMVIQVLINSIALFQIVAQCGPNPYRPANNVNYFHYMWNPLPADGSVKCQSPSVQTTLGFVQGAFNCAMDFLLTALSAVELWHSLFQTLDQGLKHKSLYSSFKDMNPLARSRRIWQTVTLSGPLLLSGIACIVRTCLLKVIGEKKDFTYKIMDFVLWVNIENYCILLGSCAAVVRLFLRFFVDQHHKAGHGLTLTRKQHTEYSTNHRHSLPRNARLEMYQSAYRNSQATSSDETAVEMVTEGWHWIDIEGKRSRPAPPIWMDEPKEVVDTSNAVTVQTDIIVEVRREVPESSSSRGHDASSTSRLV